MSIPLETFERLTKTKPFKANNWRQAKEPSVGDPEHG